MPFSATGVGHIYQLIAVSQFQSGAPFSGSNARIFRNMATTLRLAGFIIWRVHEHGGMPEILDPVRAPNFATGGFIESHERFAFDARIDDHPVFVEGGRSGGAPAIEFVTDLCFPQLLASVVKGERARFSKKRIDRSESATGVLEA
jgi:hypothetical protein